MNKIRIGQGFDVHRLVSGRPLLIGGVKIEFNLGLDGHSDADVLLHAIMDALLGAAGLPDIGQQFPPTDQKYKDADSAELLKGVHAMVRAAGWDRIENIDATIMAERPRMNPHVEAMKKRVAELLAIETDRINIKATTCEQLGFVGREEGIAAMAVCLIGSSG
ncbi:MAG: 2-C-methyl-D-erythritol 2,4-cyclodiphosphate synthase [candidate division Zixibacteria bacterium]|nr:2-C-methyl-D-erythritol 2,4-cyclodiphosphate synthase [candidate division Zixibacteria bacterium]